MFNGAVRCVSSCNHNFMKPNKIYIFKDGRTIREDGDKTHATYSDFQNLCRRNLGYQEFKLIDLITNEK